MMFRVLMILAAGFALLPPTSADGLPTTAGVALADASDSGRRLGVNKIEKLLWDNIASWLHAPFIMFFGQDCNGQLIVCLIMLIFGKFMVWDGQKAFKGVITVGSGFVTYILAMSQLRLAVGDQLGPNITFLVGIELAAVASWVVYAGFDAAQYALGVIVGCILSSIVVGKVADHFGEDVAANFFFVLINWNLWTIASLYLFSGKGRLNKIVMTGIFSFVGGLFISASLTYLTFFVSTFFRGTSAATSAQAPATHPRGGFWVDYLYCILHSQSRDVGIFADKPTLHVSIFGEVWYLDCLIGRIGWVIFFAVGCFIAWKVHPAIEEMKAENVKNGRRPWAGGLKKRGTLDKIDPPRLIRPGGQKTQPLLG